MNIADIEPIELSLLRAALDKGTAPEVFSKVTPDHFISGHLRDFFRVARVMYQSDRYVTAEGLKMALLANGSTDPDMIDKWVDAISTSPPPVKVDYMVGVLARAKLATMVEVLSKDLSGMTGAPIEKPLHRVNKFVNEVHTLSSKKYETLGEALRRVLNRAEPPRILTPDMGDLDDKLRIRPGSITYIGADSGTGKSSLMVNMAINIARKGHHVAIASIEMTNEELAVRAGGILGGVDTERLEDSLLNPTEMEHMQFIVEQNKEIMKRVHLIDPATLDVDVVPSLVNEAVVRFGVVAFFLDYVQKCQAKGPTIITKTDRVAYISEVLTATAKSTQVPIIALAQLSRDASVSAGSGKKKGMHNLRDTSQLENDAHTVALMHDTGRMDDDRHTKYIEISIEKNRKGKKGSEIIAFHLPSQRMEHSGRTMKDFNDIDDFEL